MATKTDTAPFEPSGLVFDCDGTLVDTMFFYWHSWEVICEKYGIKFDMKRFFSFAGVPVRDIYQTLIDEQFTDGRPKPDLDQLLEEKHEIVKEDRKVNPPGPIKCVVDIVKKYHGKIPMAVASSGKRECVHEDLRRNGLTGYFDAVVTCEDVVNGKPAPDIFLLACKKINVPPEKCRGFEDADLGMVSLNRAGMDAVDVRLMPDYPHKF
jgi:beta-phosphoglucomutase-like phosphatase (HAD superfamily)|eukprot:g7460.t1